VLVVHVDARHIAATGTQAYSLDSSRILLKLERVNFVTSRGIPDMNWWRFTDLPSDDLGTVCGNVEAKDIITVKLELITIALRSHRHLFASIELLSVLSGIVNYTEWSDHVHSLSFRGVTSVITSLNKCICLLTDSTSTYWFGSHRRDRYAVRLRVHYSMSIQPLIEVNCTKK
jgi:hypothetical protein